ncbi:DUF1178 family protein [Amorphus sp. 3PC139-8]|uniref:DUF1178 family protein n=1 Tax=Amorphus sp. 3PC139-8 TaxID=2735676 RepID=UPI00345D0060
MIRYRLVCDQRHDFEAWFRSSDDCDHQLASGALTCPMCGSATIERGLMAPSISKARREVTPQAPAPEAQSDSQPVLAPDPKLAAMVSALREIRDRIVASSDDVGDRFSEEARRIHYGESEARGIYGQASADEAAELLDEGIQVMPLPVFPDERN